jgi:signal transduction histidine kinase
MQKLDRELRLFFCKHIVAVPKQLLVLLPLRRHYFRCTFFLLCLFFHFLTTPLQTQPTMRLPGRLTPLQIQAEEQMLQRLALANDTLRVEILDSLTWTYRGTDFARAMHYAQQAQSEVARLGFPRVRAENKNYMGIIYRNLGDYSKAMECFVQARTIAEEHGYRREEAYALNNIGDVYKYERKYAESQSFSRKALRIFEEMRDTSGMYYCHIRLGEIAQSLNDYPAALRSFDNTVTFSQAFKNEVWEAGSRNRIGQVYRQQGLYQKALRSFFAALAISKRVPHDEDEQALILIHIGKTYSALQKNDSALTFLLNGYRLADTIGLKQHIRDAAQSLAKIYTDKSNFAEALRFQTIQMAMNDSLFSEASRRNVEKISAKYELEKQQDAIDLLNASQQKERVIGIGLVVGVFLLVVLALILYRNAQAEHLANMEILRQQRVLEDQSAEIEITNTKLQEQNSELSALNLEKNELMGIVAHDLKNPIGAVIGLAELMVNGTIRQEVLVEAAKQIVGAGERMLALVTNVLDINRLEAGGMGFAIVELDILPVVEATYWQYQTAAEMKRITMHYQPMTTSAKVFADEQAMMQVLDNIISNAVKYSPHGKSIFIRVKSSLEAVRVEIQDEGEGISPNDMQKLFGKFARLSARPTGGEHSTGLGLSIVKKMVEAMNGKVWCESEVEKGATFIVELPIAGHN